MQEPLSLTTLLSQVLTGFTIEADNEFERQMTQIPAPLFLVSLVMGLNFMRFVPDEGIRVRELSVAAGFSKAAHPSMPGMERWGYITVMPDNEHLGPKQARQNWIVTPTPGGRKAKEVWQILSKTIEDRWRQRFGQDLLETLSASLQALLPHQVLPAYLPVLMSKGFFAPNYTFPPGETGSELLLPSLLSQVLLIFTLEYEREAELSLPLCVNVLRCIDAQGVPERDLPLLSGISKQAISMSLNYLAKNDYLIIETAKEKAGPKSVRLTQKGLAAQADSRARIDETERQWRERFGESSIHELKTCLSRLLTHKSFVDGLIPPDGVWRGKKPFIIQTRAILDDPQKLPQYPMVLHRGGYPDGS